MGAGLGNCQRGGQAKRRRAEPRELLADAHVRRHDIGAGGFRQQQVGRRLQLIVPLEARSERQRERAGSRRNPRVADLRVETSRGQIRIVIERRGHGLVNGQTDRECGCVGGLCEGGRAECGRQNESERCVAHHDGT